MGRMTAWWSSLGFGKAAPADDNDFADMGTAFGLDASMDTVPSAYLPPTSANPEAPTPQWPGEQPGLARR